MTPLTPEELAADRAFVQKYGLRTHDEFSERLPLTPLQRFRDGYIAARAESAKEIAELKAQVASLTDSECDKVMAMTDNQSNALTVMSGSNPKDVASLGKQAFELALLTVKNERLKAKVDGLRKQYNDLLFCVSKKYPGESRHDTAKRYLLDREKFSSGEGSAATAQEKPNDR